MWGKALNTFNNIAGSAAGNAQVQAEFKKKEKQIKDLQAEVQKLKQDIEFINKSYEELETTNRHQEELLQNINQFTSQCVQQIINQTKQMQDSICAHFSDRLNEIVDQMIGEDIEMPEMVFSITSPQFVHQNLKPIFQTLLKEASTIQTMEEQLRKVKEEAHEKQQQFMMTLRSKKQETDIIIKEMKNMLTTEKQRNSKLNMDINQLKISQEKYQKQIYKHCQENNHLIAQNKQLTATLAQNQGFADKLKTSNQKKSKALEELQTVGQQIRQAKQEICKMIADISQLKAFDETMEESLMKKLQNILRFKEQKQQNKQGQKEEDISRLEDIMKDMNQQVMKWVQTESVSLLVKSNEVMDKVGQKIGNISNDVIKMGGKVADSQRKWKEMEEKWLHACKQIQQFKVEQALSLKGEQAKQQQMIKQMQQKQNIIQKMQQQKEQHISDINELHKQKASFDQFIHKKQQELQILKQQMHAQMVRLSMAENERQQHARQQMETLEEQKNRLQEQKNRLEEQKNRLGEQNNRLQKQIEGLKQENQSRKQQNIQKQQVSQKYSILVEQVQALKCENKELQQKIKLICQNSNYKQGINQQNQGINQQKQGINKQKQGINQSNIVKNEQKIVKNQENQRINQQNERINQLEQQISILNQTIAKNNQQIQNKTEMLNARTQQLQTLQQKLQKQEQQDKGQVEIQAIKQQCRNLKAQKQELSHNLVELTKLHESTLQNHKLRQNQILANMKQIQSSLDDKEQHVRILREQKQQHDNQYQKLKQQFQAKKTQLEDLLAIEQETHKISKEEMDQKQQQLRNIHEKMAAKQTEVQQLVNQIQQLKNKLQEGKRQSQSIYQKYEQEKQKIIQQNQNLINLKNDQFNQIAQKHNKKCQQFEQILHKIDNLQAALSQKDEQLQEKSTKIEIMEEKQKQLSQSLNNMQKSLEQTNKLLEAEKDENFQMKGDLQIMKQMSSSMDQQYQQLENLKKQQKHFEIIQKVYQEKWNVPISDAHIKQIHSKFLKIEQNLKSNSEELSSAKEKCEQNCLKITQLQKKKQKLQKQSEQNEKHLTQVINDNSGLKIKYQEMNQQYKNMKNRSDINQQKFNTLKEQYQKFSLIHEQFQSQNKKLSASNEKLKKELQAMKNKNESNEKNLMQSAMGNNQMKQKLKNMEDTLNQFKKKQGNWQKQKNQYLVSKKKQDQEIRKLQTEMQKVIIDSTDRIKRQKNNIYRDMADREEVFKSEKIGLEKKFLAEIDKIKNQVKAKQKKIAEKDVQINGIKQKLTEEKKLVAQLNAKIEEAKNIQSKIEGNQSEKVQLKKKLMMKEQQLKKSYGNLQNLKSTISELEEGIETYQSYAEEKNKQIQQIQALYEEIKEKYADLAKQKLKVQHKFHEQLQIYTNTPKKEAVKGENKSKQQELSDRKQLMLPIKRLFLKYFESSSSYEQKVHTLTTLCQVLGLDKNEQDIIKHYKKSKLIAPSEPQKNRNQQKIENKFFEFLTADS